MHWAMRANEGNDPCLRKAVEELGAWIGNSGNALVYGGSKGGLMGALADSVLKAGGDVTGVEPNFFIENEFQLKYVHQTSWGMTTRMIGAIIMVHGDNSGLKLPPRIAPVQAVIIPIQQRKEGVLEKAAELNAALKAAGIRVKTDDTDKSPGFKFAEQEMRGIPVRIECGPKDIEANQAVVVRRDTREKIVVCLDELAEKVQEILDSIQHDMLEAARSHRDSHTYVATNYDEFVTTINEKPGFIKAMWCGCQECEDKIKEDTAATSRCIPFEQEHLSDTCVCCGKPAKKMVYWGRAY